MFGTLRYGSQEDDSHFIPGPPGTDSGVPGPSPRYSACDQCRGKKQRCSGQRNGCERCRRTSSTCTYTQDGRAKRGRKDSRNSRNGGQTDSSDAPPPSPAPTKRSDTADRQRAGVEAQDMSRETSCPSPEAMVDTNLTDDATAFGEFDFTSDQMLNDIFPGLEAESDDPLLEALTLPSLDGLSHDHSFGADASVNVGTPPDLMTFLPNSFDQFQQSALSPKMSIDSFCSSPTVQVDLDNMIPKAPASKNKAYEALDENIQDSWVGNVQKHSNQSPQRTKPCRCCNVVASMLERLEARNSLVDRSALDKTLASQREALNHCNSVLQCRECVLRPEYILLLGVVAERLTTSCESTVAQYLSESSLQSRTHHSAFGRGTSKPSKEQDRIYIGSYGIESVEEWHGLMRFLIAQQLRSLGHLLRSMKKVAASGVSMTRLPNIGATERRVAALIEKIRKSQA